MPCTSKRTLFSCASLVATTSIAAGRIIRAAILMILYDNISLGLNYYHYYYNDYWYFFYIHILGHTVGIGKRLVLLLFSLDTVKTTWLDLAIVVYTHHSKTHLRHRAVFNEAQQHTNTGRYTFGATRGRGSSEMFSSQPLQ